MVETEETRVSTDNKMSTPENTYLSKNRIMRAHLLIAGPAIVTMILFTTSVYYFTVPFQKQNLADQQYDTIRDLTTAAWHVLGQHHAMEQNGERSLAEAQTEARYQLRNMRYGDHGKNYFWIVDLSGTCIVNPFSPELEGTSVLDLTDSHGKSFIREFISVATGQKQGYVEYYWKWNDDPGRIARKVSFVKLFEPWGWMIGTGVYVEDVRLHYSQAATRLFFFAGIILFLAFLMSIVVVWQGAKADTNWRRARALAEHGEDELRQLAAAIEEVAESIIITDAKGAITYVNPCCEFMTGYSRDELMGKNSNIFSSGQHNDAFYGELWATIRSGKIWHGQFTNRRKDGSLFEEEATISPVRDGGGEIVSYVAVKRDISHEALLEDQVRQSQKMAAIGQFAHRVAHDVTNVLTMILGNAQLAKMKLDPKHEVQTHLDEVVAAATRMSMFTADLLAFAHPGGLTLRKGRIEKTVKELESMLHQTLPDGITLVIDAEDKLEKVNMDATQIEQAIIHLAINAGEAMPDGGKLTIRVAEANPATDESGRLTRQRANEDGEPHRFAVVEITDTGLGMSKEDQAKVFEPFFTTRKGTHRNAGLGLATVYRIIDQHNGFITVDSQVGSGTTFRIFLPFA